MCFGDAGCAASPRLSKNASESSTGGSAGDVGVLTGLDASARESSVSLIDKAARDFSRASKASPNSRWRNISRLASSVNKILINVQASCSSPLAMRFFASQNLISASVSPPFTASSNSELFSFTTKPSVVSLLTEITVTAPGVAGAPWSVAPCATSLPPNPKVAPQGRFNQFGARFIGIVGPALCWWASSEKSELTP